MKRFLILFFVFGLIGGSVEIANAGQSRPVRSGTILTGSATGLIGFEPLGCETVPDCRAWLERDCDPALSGRNPALTASIEDVADLAVGTRAWLFQHNHGAAANVTIELWGQDCQKIRSRRWDSTKCTQGPIPVPSHWPNGCYFLEIPSSTKWMTVTGYTFNPWAVWLPLPSTEATFDWTLRPYSRRSSTGS